jgi:hypothetical protein
MICEVLQHSHFLEKCGGLIMDMIFKTKDRGWFDGLQFVPEGLMKFTDSGLALDAHMVCYEKAD